MADKVHPVVEAMAKALDEAQFWTRFNDFTADRVEGYPIEVCRYGREGEDEIVVVARFPSGYGENIALAEVSRIERAKAAAKVLIEECAKIVERGMGFHTQVDEILESAATAIRALSSEMGV